MLENKVCSSSLKKPFQVAMTLNQPLARIIKLMIGEHDNFV